MVCGRGLRRFLPANFVDPPISPTTLLDSNEAGAGHSETAEPISNLLQVFQKLRCDWSTTYQLPTSIYSAAIIIPVG